MNKSPPRNQRPPRTTRFSRVLIANRGEIAVRIASTLREMGLSPCTVFSDADRAAPHVRVCDAAVHLGASPARESYLVIDKILAAAKQLGCEAVHPGYGFLSENGDFAEACEKAGVTLIGPPSSAMRAMGSKTEARRLMHAAGVPIVPGTEAPLTGSDADIAALASEIGYPLMLKAVAGGGGKGMRLVREESELAAALRAARGEAKSAFGDDRVYWERAIVRPRHVEIQVLCDAHGHGVHFGERDCSVQRRHQKIIEESPSTAVTPELRQRMGEVAVKGALAVGYVGAGTMEFLLDSQGSFYFLEMNTRLQVEHPVTEAVYGIDLVREQVRIAAGETLGYNQSQIVPRGHALEARVYAEDPNRGFMPSPGRIESLVFPAGPGLRVDSGVCAGFTVPMFYDPMIAKITAWAPTREQALERLRRALGATTVAGITTNVEFLDAVLDHAAFRRGDVHTGFIDQHLQNRDRVVPRPLLNNLVIASAIQKLLVDRQRPRAAAAQNKDSGWARAGRLTALSRGFLDR